MRQIVAQSAKRELSMHALTLLLVIVLTAPATSTAASTDAADLTAQIYQKRQEVDAAEIARLKSENAQLHNQTTHDYQDYLKQFYAMDIAARRQSLDAYRWQLNAASIVLWLIIGISLSGIAFSGMQLWHGLRFKRKSDNDVDLEISVEKLRLKSSVIGLTVLVLSGTFFLIFVEKIYRIEAHSAAGSQPKAVENIVQLRSPPG